jgi:multiple sugar transport system substrate-binding protein
MMGAWDWSSVFLGQWGASIFTPQGTRSTLDSPEAAAAAQFYQDLIYKYGVLPSPTNENAMATAGGWGSGTISLFGAGRGAMAVGGRWWLCILRGKDYAKLKLGAIELPHGPSRRIFGGGRSTLVNAKGKNIEGALTFLEYMHGEHWNNLVNQQADALAPVMKYNYTDDFLHNPEHPEEDYNAVWRSALENAIPMEVSPYVNGQTVDRILLKQSDLLRENLKTGSEAMRDATRAINEAIIEQVKADPVLKERYDADLANGAAPAWDRPEDAP